MEVLMDHYWTKGYAQRMPEFTEHVLEYYKQWQDGNLDLETVKEDLWRYAGVKLEVEDKKAWKKVIDFMICLIPSFILQN